MLKRSDSTVYPPLEMCESVGTTAVAAAAVVVLGQPDAVAFPDGFPVQLVHAGAHPHQFLTCHAGQYNAALVTGTKDELPR